MELQNKKKAKKNLPFSLFIFNPEGEGEIVWMCVCHYMYCIKYIIYTVICPHSTLLCPCASVWLNTYKECNVLCMPVHILPKIWWVFDFVCGVCVCLCVCVMVSLDDRGMGRCLAWGGTVYSFSGWAVKAGPPMWPKKQKPCACEWTLRRSRARCLQLRWITTHLFF